MWPRWGPPSSAACSASAADLVPAADLPREPIIPPAPEPAPRSAERDLVIPTERGPYCPAGDFYIDPWRPVPRAVITHAHADHARPGSERYLAAAPGLPILRRRLGDGARLETLAYGETTSIDGVRVSLHPAGHLKGSAQVRLEHRGRVWVVSGDYKTTPDATCEPFEAVRCHTFITESTFGLPIFRWPDQERIFAGLVAWWQENQRRGHTSILLAYALGKAQRLLAGIAAAWPDRDPEAAPMLGHGAVMSLVDAYREAGVALPELTHASVEAARAHRGRALVVAPPSAAGSPWVRKFGPSSLAFASGWMAIRGIRRRRGMDRGFVLSDHADWAGLEATVDATGAERIGVTHGYTEAYARHLRERGLDAWTFPTRYTAGGDDPDEPPSEGSGTSPEVSGTSDRTSEKPRTAGPSEVSGTPGSDRKPDLSEVSGTSEDASGSRSPEVSGTSEEEAQEEVP